MSGNASIIISIWELDRNATSNDRGILKSHGNKPNGSTISDEHALRVVVVVVLFLFYFYSCFVLFVCLFVFCISSKLITVEPAVGGVDVRVIVC